MKRYSGKLGDGYASVYQPRAPRRRTVHPLALGAIVIGGALVLWRGLPLAMVIIKAVSEVANAHP